MFLVTFTDTQPVYLSLKSKAQMTLHVTKKKIVRCSLSSLFYIALREDF